MITKKSLLEVSASQQDGNMQLPRVRWIQLLAISVFWFALNFHWNALLTVIVPSQVLVLAGNAHKIEALTFVLIPGAFVSLLANPLFGWLSDLTYSRWSRWRGRRPYILVGTLVNVAGLIWMVRAPNIVSLMLAYALVQLSSNAAQAPFHALLPDLVPAEQRGLASGLMGLMMIAGSIAGITAAGLFVNAELSPPAYQQALWMIYAIIILILLAFMLITVCLVRERTTTDSAAQSSQALPRPAPANPDSRIASRQWRDWSLTIGRVLLVLGLLWISMQFWNRLSVLPIHFTTDVQQMILEVGVTIGLLRLFQFSPRRDPNFAWVLITRFLMMMSIATIQNWMQYYLHDIVGIARPELETAKFFSIVAVTGLLTTLLAGWLSDRLGRKRLVYFAGGLMAGAGLLIVVVQAVTREPALIWFALLVSGICFGCGYGAYQSVDWALVADVLPSRKTYAGYMGIWNISLSLPQVVAPVIAGSLVATFSQQGMPALGYQLLFAVATLYCLIGTVTVRYIQKQA